MERKRMGQKRDCKCCNGKGKIKCPKCGGYGTMDDKKKSTCYYCQGDKVVNCPVCGGTGKIEDD